MAPLFTGLKLGGFGKNPDVAAAVAANTITIKVWGAGGGRGDNGPHNSVNRFGAPGGAFTISQTPYSSIGLSPGNTLYIYVGQGGRSQDSGGAGGGNGGHPGRGGNGSPPDAGGGGGMTSIYLNGGFGSGTLYAIAAGGGGASAGFMWAAGGYPFGIGGGPVTGPQIPGWTTYVGPAGVGGGGTQSAGGAVPGGSGYGGAPGGNTGSQFTGGDGGDSGGGGAGYYGGASGMGDYGTVSGSGGGGGSNYHNPAYIPPAFITHANILTDPQWAPYAPNFTEHPTGPALNSTDPQYSPGKGNGGPPAAPGDGGPGYVVITTSAGTSTFSYTGSVQTFVIP